MKRYLLLIWLLFIGLIILCSSCSVFKSKKSQKIDSVTVKVQTLDSVNKKDSAVIKTETETVIVKKDSTATTEKKEIIEDREETHYDTSGHKIKVIITKTKTKSESGTHKEEESQETTHFKRDSAGKSEFTEVHEEKKDSTSVKKSSQSKGKFSVNTWPFWIVGGLLILFIFYRKFKNQ